MHVARKRFVFCSPELTDVSRETYLRKPQQPSAIFDVFAKNDRHCARTSWSSERFVAVDCYAFHPAVRGAIVRDDSMLRTSVVPHRNRVRTPSEAATEIRRLYMSIKKIQQKDTLGRLHSLDRCGERRVDE